MKKHEINTKPVIVNPKQTLASHKRKIIAHLQKEICEMVDKRFLQIRLGIFIFEAEKFQDNGVGLILCAEKGASTHLREGYPSFRNTVLPCPG